MFLLSLKHFILYNGIRAGLKWISKRKDINFAPFLPLHIQKLFVYKLLQDLCI